MIQMKNTPQTPRDKPPWWKGDDPRDEGPLPEIKDMGPILSTKSNI